jgi:hypothetical protein
MEQSKLKVNMSTYRRLKIQHKMDENLLEQNHLSNLQFHKYREEMFDRKIDRLRKSIEHIQPYTGDDDNDDEQITRTPNCFPRIKTHFHLLNFSSQTEKRLLCQAPIYNKTSKQISNHLPNIPRRTNSNEISQCLKRISFYQTRSPTIYSCRSNSNEEKYFRAFVNQQIFAEHKKQLKNEERKSLLLKQFDELKHTINDPHSTLSVLAALSRALLHLDSGKK